MTSATTSKCTPVRALALATTMALAACSGSNPDNSASNDASSAGEYIVERSAADGVDTVRTVSGSRWGGEGQLVEELSIGVDMGDEPYLFGSITSAWATEDRIYIVDSQVPAVRAFDLDGNYLFDVGNQGQGPGEYSQPVAMAVTDDGRILVTDVQGARLNIFDSEGGAIDDWRLGSPMAAMGLEITYDAEIFTRVLEMPNMKSGGNFEVRMGMQAIGPDGLVGEPLFPPPIEYDPPTVSIDMMGNSRQMAILPFTPSYEWVMAPGGEMIVGVGNEYRFEIHAPTGNTTIVEKNWNPVAVDPGEVTFRADMAVSNFRRMAPDFALDESEVPAHKAAFTRFRADRSGRVWVVHQGPSRPDPECTEIGGSGGGMRMMISAGPGVAGADVKISSGGMGGDEEYDGECWANTYVFDVFELTTGEFLGSVPAPEQGFNIPLFVDGDTVLASVTGTLGITRLKKYRLVTE